MDEDVRADANEEQEQEDPREAGKKPGVETWPVIGGKPGKNAGEE